MTAQGTRRLASQILPKDKRASGWTRPVALCIDALARFGYVARGAVYVTVGGLSLYSALFPERRAEGPIGAMQIWAHWPLGVLLLTATAFGLIAHAVWRFMQAALDADRVGASPEGLMKRAGKASEGVVNFALALSIFHLLLTLAGSSAFDDQASVQAIAQRALSMPGGGIVMIAVGAGVAACGVANMWRSVTGHFTEELDCEGFQAQCAGIVGRLGHFSQGFSLLAVGALTGLAGLQARAAHARGLGGALETLKDQPMGNLLLAALGGGLVAYGVFAFAKAALRRIGR